MIRLASSLLLFLLATPALSGALRGSGDLGLVIERADSSIQIVETSGNTSIASVGELGDLSHASVVYSRDARFAARRTINSSHSGPPGNRINAVWRFNGN